MSNELQALKQELQQKGSQNRPQDEELISAMREQVKHIPQSSSTGVRHPKSLRQRVHLKRKKTKTQRRCFDFIAYKAFK